jgi:hypothetical protein
MTLRAHNSYGSMALGVFQELSVGRDEACRRLRAYGEQQEIERIFVACGHAADSGSVRRPDRQ